MNGKIMVLFVFMTTLSLSVSGQRLIFDFPEQKGDSVILWETKGLKKEVLYRGVFDPEGQLEITVSGHRLRGFVTLDNMKGSALTFILGNENVSITSKEKYPVPATVKFTHSAENEHFFHWMELVNTLKGKEQANRLQQQLYKPTEVFYSSIEEEKKRLSEQRSDYEKAISDTSLYSARVMQLIGFMEDKLPVLFQNDTTLCEGRDYLLSRLDVEALYTSGLWFNILNGFVELYQSGHYPTESFGSDMVLLLKRTSPEEVFLSLASDLIMICDQLGWQDNLETIGLYLIDSGRLKNPEGRLKDLTVMMKIRKGSKAPALVTYGSGKDNPLPGSLTVQGPALLLFYESGCDNCEKELSEFQQMYTNLKYSGIEIYSISADRDSAVYSSRLEKLPWRYKFCDWKGFSGKNVENYGIIGTPTIFLIDEKGIIQGRYARLEDAVPNLVKN